MDFRQYLEQQGLASSTIKNHLKNVTEYGKVGGSQRIMILRIEALKPSLATRLSMAGSISKLLQYNNKPNEEMVEYIKKTNAQIQANNEQKQKEMSVDETLPTMKEIKNYMNSLYDKEKYYDYAILYLMTTYQTRNKDLILTIVKNKKETNDTDNFIVLGKSQATYIRNDYKTSYKYGAKTHVIKNLKFMNAIQGLSHLLKTTDNIDRVIKKVTAGIGSINEGTLAKIVLKENNTINGLKKVSKNRGTDINTLINSYNIT
jgi:vacuolar-type H+-ATPase subunit I/STV1